MVGARAHSGGEGVHIKGNVPGQSTGSSVIVNHRWLHTYILLIIISLFLSLLWFFVFFYDSAPFALFA